MSFSRFRFVLLSAVSAIAAACAAPQAARLQLPEPLQRLEPERLEGAGGARRGAVVLPGFEARFERSADRLGLLDERLARDTASLQLEWSSAPNGAATSRMDCRGRQVEVGTGAVVVTARPFALECRPAGAATGALQLEGRAAAAGTRQERLGHWSAAGRRFEIRSVHELEGAAWPQAVPFGYVLSDGATPVAAIELNGAGSRVWRPTDPALREAVTPALVLLGLLWDPAR